MTYIARVNIPIARRAGKRATAATASQIKKALYESTHVVLDSSSFGPTWGETEGRMLDATTGYEAGLNRCHALVSLRGLRTCPWPGDEMSITDWEWECDVGWGVGGLGLPHLDQELCDPRLARGVTCIRDHVQSDLRPHLFQRPCGRRLVVGS